MRGRVLVAAVVLVAGASKARLPTTATGPSRSFASEHRRPATPGRVTDLRAQALTDSSVVLQWTEVASNTTVAARYVVRFDRLGQFTWAGHPDVVTGGCAAPVVGSRPSGGRPQACVLDGLAPNTAYEFQIVAYIGTLGNLPDSAFGGPSNIAEATTMQRVGPMLVWRPRMFLDSLTIAAVSLTDFGATRFPLRGTFRFGDRRATFFDSTGAVAGRGYLLVTP